MDATWLLVKTRKICNSASGANPRHSLLEAIMPATKVPCPNPSSNVFSFVQLVRSLIRLKWGCVLARPVSKTATLTPAPEKKTNQLYSFPYSFSVPFRLDICRTRKLEKRQKIKHHTLNWPCYRASGFQGSICKLITNYNCGKKGSATHQLFLMTTNHLLVKLMWFGEVRLSADVGWYSGLMRARTACSATGKYFKQWHLSKGYSYL